MKMTLIFLLLPVFAKAHCPVELLIGQQSLCAEIEWAGLDKKVKGQLVSAEGESPYLIPTGEPPMAWLYSQALIRLWEKGDSQHTPVEVADFRVFPYMQMANGHHHSTSHDFSFDPGLGAYRLRGIAFVEMPGVWELRWSLSEASDLDSSVLVEVFSSMDGGEHHHH